MYLPVLETERLRIRPFRSDDLENAHRLYTEIGWVEANQTPEEQRHIRRTYVEWNSLNTIALAQLYQPPTGDRVIELKASGEFIGACGAASLWIPMGQLPSFGGQQNAFYQPEVSLFWALRPLHQRQGYAPEMARALTAALFGRFRLRRIVAFTEYDNRPSQRVMEKIGMTIERNPFPQPTWLQVIGILNHPLWQPDNVPS